MTKKTKSKSTTTTTNNKKRKVPASNRASVRAAKEALVVAKPTPTRRGKNASTPIMKKKTPTTVKSPPKTPKNETKRNGVQKPKSSTKRTTPKSKRSTPGAPKNTSSYIMNNRKFGAQPPTPRPLSSMKSPRLESIALATTKPPDSGIDMFGSMIGAVSPRAMGGDDGMDDAAAQSEHVAKLCSIIAEQAQKIQQLETELSTVRAQLQARAVAPVPTLRRVPSSTSVLASRIAGLFRKSQD